MWGIFSEFKCYCLTAKRKITAVQINIIFAVIIRLQIKGALIFDVAAALLNIKTIISCQIKIDKNIIKNKNFINNQKLILKILKIIFYA